VRRRYSRLLREQSGSNSSSPSQTGERDEEDRPIVEELRTLMNNPGEAFPRIAEEQRRKEENASSHAQADETPSASPRASSAEAAEHVAGAPNPSVASNMPDLIVIDGGKGQLNAAHAELKKLGLERIPIIGLAKEFEEIYLPGEREPLRLPHENNALKLLQRIRDESHRVANSYNAQLRVKKISESILDEFPGIGERRKSALLKKFGSVQRLRVASVEDIASVPGFGGKAAGELKAFLDARSGELLEGVAAEKAVAVPTTTPDSPEPHQPRTLPKASARDVLP
jgi:excinuclease UvrABC nuclease subunit